MSDSDVEIIAALNLSDRETEVEHKEQISEESSAVNEEKAQAGFEPPKQDSKKPVKSIKEGSSIENEGKAQASFEPPEQVVTKEEISVIYEGKAEAAFEPPEQVVTKEESSVINEGKAEAAFEPPEEVVTKEESSIINEGKAEAAFGPPEQMKKKQVKRGRKNDGRRTKYNAEGIHKGTQLDLCDCLNPGCPGCWFPCKNCSSTKCGHKCRQNRRWEYESIHIEGTSINIKNPFKNKNNIENPAHHCHVDESLLNDADGHSHFIGL